MKTTDFEIGSIVFDSENDCYGVVLNNFPEEPDSGEIRLDSDGMRPIRDLCKLGDANDTGTKEQLIECLEAHKRLVVKYGYEPVKY